MITLRCVSQPQFPEGFVKDAVGGLWEPWMRVADRILEDEQLLSAVYEALVGAIPRAARGDVWERPPRLWCACCCSSISATGVSMCWSAKYGPTSYTGSSRA